MDKISWWLLAVFLVLISINYSVASDGSSSSKEQPDTYPSSALKTKSYVSLEDGSSFSKEQPDTYPSSSLKTTSYVSLEACQQTYMDFAFLVDASGSVGTAHFQEQLRFLQTFILTMPIDGGNVRIGIVVFGTEARVEFTLSKFNSTKEINDAISAITLTYDGSNTNVAAALKLTRTQVFTQERGDRDNVTNVAILIADGSPNKETSSTDPQAKELRNGGVRIIVLAITSNPEVFDTIASKPTSDNIISIDSFSKLDSVHSILHSLLCNESKTESKKSTKKPATPPTSPPQSKSERTTISASPNSETETPDSKTPTNTMKSTKKPATPPSSSRFKSERTTISTRPTSGTETSASKIPTNTLATTLTPIAPISTTAYKVISTATHMTSTQDKTTPGFTTTTSTARADTNPVTIVNTKGSSSTLSGLSVSDIITSTINAALQRCYERCENPVGATSTYFRAIKGLRLEKKGLSKHRREKTTASDDRQSASVVASVVLAIACTPILCLVIWDLIDLCCNREGTKIKGQTKWGS